MLLKYTGRKEQYVLKRKNLYVFAPCCEVTDENDLKFCLDPGLKGLFVPADKAVKKDKPARRVKGLDAEKEGFKCEVCGFVAKSRLGLISHSRKHEK